MGMEDKGENVEKLSLLDEDKNHNEESNGFDIIRKIKGIVSAFLWVFFMVVSVASDQQLERGIPDFERNAFRYGLPLVIGSAGILVTRKWPVIERKEITATAVYSLNNFFNSMTMFVAASLLPVASVQSVMQTTNLMSGILLFYLVLDDKPKFLVLLSALMCMFGIVLVIQPPFIFVKREFCDKSLGNVTFDNDTFHVITNLTHTKHVGKCDMKDASDFWLLDILKYALAIATGFSLALDVVIVKKRPYLKENITAVLFWSFLLISALSAIVMVIVEKPVLPGNWYDAFLVTSHSMSNLFVWSFYLYSLRHVSGNTLNVIGSTAIVFLLVSQYTVLSSILPGNRNWIEVVGVFLVLLGSGLGSVVELFKDVNWVQ